MGHTRDSVRAVLEELSARLDELEERNDAPEGIGKALADAGIVRLLAPRPYGGNDGTVVESMEILEDIASVDASVAWRSLVACEVAPVLARLPQPTLEALYSAGPDFIGGALFAPKGMAVETKGGFRVSGRWPNVSGCDRCVWLCGMCTILDEHGNLRRNPDGSPVVRVAVFPAANARKASTWKTIGLHAAGGHDVVVDDVFVPVERTFDLFAPVQAPPSRAARLPMLSVFSLHAGAVALGVAAGALDDVTAIGGPTAAEQAARSTLDRARELLYELGDRFDASVTEDIELRNAGVTARATSSWVVAAAGSIVSTALESGPTIGPDIDATVDPMSQATLLRRFRDIHALSQHVALIQDHLSPSGAVVVGPVLATA